MMCPPSFSAFAALAQSIKASAAPRQTATLASRSLLERCDPKLVMRLALQDRREDTQHTLDLETDVKTLENIVLSLEEALNEANTPSVRKLCKRYSVERAK